MKNWKVLGPFAMIMIFAAVYAHAVSLTKEPSTRNLQEYEEVDLSHLYQKDRSFEALDQSFTSICDGILTSSKNERRLSPKQNQLVEGFIRQNELFKQKDFDEKWMSRMRQKLRLLKQKEGSRIAPALLEKVEKPFRETKSQTHGVEVH